jgi:transcriptional regulator with XRE-family HTH domain
MPRPPNDRSQGLRLEVEPEMATKRFAELLRSARMAAGKTQAEVAEKMGLLQARVAKLEAGQNEPTLTTVAKYAKAIGWRFSIRLDPPAVKKGRAPAGRRGPKRGSFPAGGG